MQGISFLLLAFVGLNNLGKTVSFSSSSPLSWTATTISSRQHQSSPHIRLRLQPRLSFQHISASDDSHSYHQSTVLPMEEPTEILLVDNALESFDVPLENSINDDAQNPYNMNMIVIESSSSSVVDYPFQEEAEEQLLVVGGVDDEKINNNKKNSMITTTLFDILDNPSLLVGRVLILVAAAVYGTNFATVKMLDEVMPLRISAALRFGLAAFVTTSFVVFGETTTTTSKDDDDDDKAEQQQLALLGGMEIGIWYLFGYICQAEGLQTIGAGKSSFFNSLAVIVVPILDAVFRGRSLQGKNIVSILLACVGVGLFELGPDGGGINVSSGDVWAMGQMLFFGVGYWRLEQTSQNHSTQSGRLTAGQLLAVAGGSTIHALSSGMDNLPSLDMFASWLTNPFIVSSLLWTGLVSTSLALYLETVALKVVSASELTLLMTTISLWGAAFAYVTIGEVLTDNGVLGGLLILCGCILGNINNEEGDVSLQDDDVIIETVD